VFVDGALPGERILLRITGKRRAYSHGVLLDIVQASDDRVNAPCEYFGTCGGCALQHLDHDTQLKIKHRQLNDNLQRIAKVSPEEWSKPLSGPIWGYRRKARLSVRYVPKKGGVLVGFHERHKSYVTPLSHCQALAPQIARLLPSLPQLVSTLSCYQRIPQIEVAASEHGVTLVIRHLEPLLASDRHKIQQYGSEKGVQILLQSKGPDSIEQCVPQQFQILQYQLPRHRIEIRYKPTDFIQVNDEMNQMLIDRAIELLAPQADERILDLFCGVGNFTLPIARYCANITGIEGDPGLVRQAKENASHNGLSNIDFQCADLFVDPDAGQQSLSGPWLQTKINKLILDPPRSGAIDVIKCMPVLDPERIVYISCNPATLARDSELLVHKLGYRLLRAGIVDMFPHTAHVESIALFTRC